MRLVSYHCSITAILGSLKSYRGLRLVRRTILRIISEPSNPHINHPLDIIYKMELATYQPRGLPMGFDHSPKPLTVDFVKLCGLRMKSVGIA